MTCEYFKLEKVRFSAGIEEAVPYDQPVVWMMLDGECELRVDDMKEPVTLKKGETVLLPASMKIRRSRRLQIVCGLRWTFPIKGELD